jgi:hypothetical protein
VVVGGDPDDVRALRVARERGAVLRAAVVAGREGDDDPGVVEVAELLRRGRVAVEGAAADAAPGVVDDPDAVLAPVLDQPLQAEAREAGPDGVAVLDRDQVGLRGDAEDVAVAAVARRSGCRSRCRR